MYQSLFIILIFPALLSASLDTSFVIITASYNNAAWYQKNIDSVMKQTYTNWRMIYINDCSTDNTGLLVSHYIKEHHLENRIIYQENRQHQGHLANQYYAISSCDNNEVVIILDGDDWLAHDNVLEYLNEVYQNPHIWLTYGQFKQLSDDSLGYCRAIENNMGNPPWVFGHLRTFYAWLFKRINKQDLQYNGAFFPMAADVAIMFPMIQMAGQRIRYIEDILYIHNDLNPLSLKKAWPMQRFLEKIIRNRPKYCPVD